MQTTITRPEAGTPPLTLRAEVSDMILDMESALALAESGVTTLNLLTTAAGGDRIDALSWVAVHLTEHLSDLRRQWTELHDAVSGGGRAAA